MTKHLEMLAFSRRGFLVGSGATAVAVVFGAKGNVIGARRRAAQRRRLRLDRRRRHRHRHLPGLRDGAGHAHGAAADPRRGSRRRLEQGSRGPGAGRRQALRQSEVQQSAADRRQLRRHRLLLPMRLAGAQARKVLLVTAAEQWKVPVGELTTEPGMVVHAKSKRKIGYGDLAKTAKVSDPLPAVTKEELKPVSAFRLIGKDVERVDGASKVNGTAQYGIDVQLPGMLYESCSIPRCSTRSPITSTTRPRKRSRAWSRSCRCRSALASLPIPSKAPCARRRCSRSPGPRRRRGRPTPRTACWPTTAPSLPTGPSLASKWSKRAMPMRRLKAPPRS